MQVSQEHIQEAAKILKSGGLVAFPTETVYGLGADAKNPEAVKKIFAAKRRPADHPLIVHLGSVKQLKDWAQDVPDTAYKLFEHFSPGPLTLILKRSDGVPNEVTGGQDTVGLRIPKHPVALELLETFGSGIAAPSANRFGRISPTTALHVAEELGDAVDMILDGGACEVGVESTIIDLSTATIRILRPGGIDNEQLAEILGVPLKQGTASSPRVSGTLESHYAPQTPLTLVHPKDLRQTADVAQSFTHCVVVALQGEPTGISLPWITMPNTPEKYAHHLYATLRDLDSLGYDRILVEVVPDKPVWAAVADRLNRAAS